MEDFTIKPIPSTLKIESKFNYYKYRVTSLDKALSILELIVDQGRDLSVMEISQKLEMSKGTVHRILATLKARRFCYQDNRTKMYGLGVRTLEIGAASKKEKFLRKVMSPFLIELYGKCGETVNVAVLEYSEIRYIYRLESEEMLRISAPAGARFPGYCAATGKVLLSYLSDDDIKRIYGRETKLKKLTNNSIGSIDALIEEINKVRVDKFAIDDEETLLGVYCVAAPILTSNGLCVAAVSISAPKNRVTADKEVTFRKLVSEMASNISDSLVGNE